MRKQCVPGSFLPAHAREPGNEAKHDDAGHIAGYSLDNSRTLTSQAIQTISKDVKPHVRRVHNQQNTQVHSKASSCSLVSTI